jgi:hypothetical protein
MVPLCVKLGAASLVCCCEDLLFRVKAGLRAAACGGYRGGSWPHPPIGGCGDGRCWPTRLAFDGAVVKAWPVCDGSRGRLSWLAGRVWLR